MRYLLMSVLLLVGCSCQTVTSESAALISTASAVGQGNLAEWAKLSDAQKHEAHWKLTRAMCVLDNTINDKDIPQAMTVFVPLDTAAVGGGQ